MNNFMRIITLLFFLFFTSYVFAAETPAKEDTTPTPPETALKAEQTPPLLSPPKQAPLPKPPTAEEIPDEDASP